MGFLPGWEAPPDSLKQLLLQITSLGPRLPQVCRELFMEHTPSKPFGPGSPTSGLWPVRNQATQQEVSGGRVDDSCICHCSHHHLRTSPPPPSLEKLSSPKLDPDDKKVGDHWFRGQSCFFQSVGTRVAYTHQSKGLTGFYDSSKLILTPPLCIPQTKLELLALSSPSIMKARVPGVLCFGTGFPHRSLSTQPSGVGSHLRPS